jgi:serine/threonine protein kinase
MALAEQTITAVRHAVSCRLVGTVVEPLSRQDLTHSIDPRSIACMTEVMRIDRITYYEAVYCARKVLVKVVPLHSTDGAFQPLLLEDSWMDATILGSFAHDSIAAFYGACFHEESLMLVVECFNKLTLKHAMRRTHLSWSVKLCLARDVLRGLAALHDDQIGHW